jgi:thioredoxin 1
MIEIKNKKDLDSNINQKDKVFLLDFFASWCAPCMRLMPILDKLKEIKKDIEIIKINSDLNLDLIVEYNIKNFPTLILYKNKKEIKRRIGYCGLEELLLFIS